MPDPDEDELMNDAEPTETDATDEQPPEDVGDEPTADDGGDDPVEEVADADVGSED